MTRPIPVAAVTCACAIAALSAAPVTRDLDASRISRLLVVAPHPDDEVIGAGGLIERVHSQRGAVRIVYLTNGDSFRAGVEAEKHGDPPSRSDYRDYGRERQHEAKKALEALGVDDDALLFLGFPNDGLTRLMNAYWSDRRPPFVSPYTRRDRPRSGEQLVPNTKYSGEDLTLELADAIGAFEPTTVVVPRREDQHADHCAAWYFTADALGDVRRVRPRLAPEVLTYIVHYNSWPFESVGRTLPVPPSLSAGPSGWLNLRLTPAEAARKRYALTRYETQMKVMDWFLLGFARENELFARVETPRLSLPIARNPCGAFENLAPPPK